MASARTYTTAYPVIQGQTTEISMQAVLDSIESRGDVDSIRNFTGNYDRILWDIDVLDGSGIVDSMNGMRIASMNELLTTLSNCVTFQGGTAQQTVALRGYDVTNAGGKRIFKVFGKNQAFARLRGRYWGSEVVVNAGITFPDRNVALDTLWQDAFTASFGKPPATWGANDLACFWMGSNRVRYYRIPPPGANLFFPDATNNRHARNDAATVPITLSSSYNESGQRRYMVFDKDGNFLRTVGWDEMITFAYPSLMQGNSHVLGIPMVNGVQRSMYLKPMGIDQICTEYFDPALYRLEAVGSFSDNSERRLRGVSSPLLPPSPERDLSGPFDSSQWMPVAAAPISRVNMGSSAYAPGSIAFQLRELSSNTVSPLSSARIDWVIKRRGKPVAAMVVNAVGSL